MANKNISAGLEGLLATKAAPAKETATEARPAPAQPARAKGNYKTVCYSIPPEVAEKVKEIAYWDRKKINEVVIEAFEKFYEDWKPSDPQYKKH